MRGSAEGSEAAETNPFVDLLVEEMISTFIQNGLTDELKALVPAGTGEGSREEKIARRERITAIRNEYTQSGSRLAFPAWYLLHKAGGLQAAEATANSFLHEEGAKPIQSLHITPAQPAIGSVILSIILREKGNTPEGERSDRTGFYKVKAQAINGLVEFVLELMIPHTGVNYRSATEGNVHATHNAVTKTLS